MPTVRLDELVQAFDFASFGSPYESNAYISRETGEIFYESEDIPADELPDDLGDPDRYIAIPHKNELDLGKRLVLKFVARDLPDDLRDVEEMFRRKGAYERFKTLLEARGTLDAWYAYEEAATHAALREWGAEAEVEVVDPPPAAAPAD